MSGEALPEGAKRLLLKLQTGDSFGVPSVYPGCLIFTTHARAFLEAAETADVRTSPDFAVFSSLYLLRHGLELWLKCIIRNELIDRFLVTAFADDRRGLDDVLDVMGGLNSKQRDAFKTCLVVFQNINDRQLRYPDCWTKHLAQSEKSLLYLRTKGAMGRNYFADYCRVQVPGHVLKELWTQAEPTIKGGLHRQVTSEAQKEFNEPVVSVSDFENAVLLMHHIDPDGAVLRYPESKKGTPNVRLPTVSLSALVRLAKDLNHTLIAYSSCRQDVYDSSTLHSPTCLRW